MMSKNCLFIPCFLLALLILPGCPLDSDSDSSDSDGDKAVDSDGDASTDGDADASFEGDEEAAADGDDLPPGRVDLHGSVEKGPFVLGSSITISPLDAMGNPTGQQFSTQTINDLGQFSVSFEASGFVSLEGSGFYYNELSGDLSGANLTLRALYEISAEGVQNAHVNLLTHLTYHRVKKLIGDGLSGAAAVEQAEEELQTSLTIGPEDLVLEGRAIEMTLLGGDTMENAYLFAVSVVLTQAARSKSPASPDAALQELINGISFDLADDGQLNAAIREQVTAAQVLPELLDEHSGDTYLIPDLIMADLAVRFADLGSTAVVPDLNRILDSDFDSIVNADDNCWWMPNFDQRDDNQNNNIDRRVEQAQD